MSVDKEYKIFSLEGIDRSGKSTVYNRLKEDEEFKKELEEKGYEVKYLKFPNKDTVWGKMVYECIKSDLSKYKDNYTLYNSKDKNEVVGGLIEEYKGSGKRLLLIVDRFDATQYIYGKSLGVENPLLGLKYRSDSSIYIDISVEESLRRGELLKDNDLIEGDSILVNLIKDNYQEYFNKGINSSVDEVYKIDGTLSKDDVYNMVCKVIKNLI